MPVRPSGFAGPRAAAELCTDGKPASDDRQPQPETTRKATPAAGNQAKPTSLARPKTRPEPCRLAGYLEIIPKRIKAPDFNDLNRQ